MDIKTAIITGPTGAIGIALIKVLTQAGVDVYAICRPNSKRLSHISMNDKVHIIECDISNYASLHDSGLKADAFFHFAWDKTTISGRDDLDCQFKNIGYTIDAVKLAKACGCSVFVGAGSQAEYGVASTPLNGNTPVFPESGYGIAKYSAGRFAGNLCCQYGIRFCWGRILSTFGEGDGSVSLISYLIRTIKNGEVPELTKCEQTWDYLFCEDAAKAFFAIAKNGKDGKTYCLGSGKPRSLKNYVEALRDCINPQAQIKFGAIPYYAHQPMILVADITELTEDTGWQPEVSFEEGIVRILNSLERYK